MISAVKKTNLQSFKQSLFLIFVEGDSYSYLYLKSRISSTVQKVAAQLFKTGSASREIRIRMQPRGLFFFHVRHDHVHIRSMCVNKTFLFILSFVRQHRGETRVTRQFTHTHDISMSTIKRTIDGLSIRSVDNVPITFFSLSLFLVQFRARFMTLSSSSLSIEHLHKRLFNMKIYRLYM